MKPSETSAALAILTALLIWESAAPFFPFFKRNLRRRTWHGLRNAFLGLLNVALIAALFVTTWAQAADWSERHLFGFLSWVGLPGWIRTLTALVFLDLSFYWWHRLNHRSPFLWRFHQTHHSDEHVDVTTANRFHVGEVFFESCLKIPLILFLGLRLEELTLYHLTVFAVSQFHHANIGLPEPVDRAIRVFFSSPAMHKVHHSCWQPETDSNYSGLFSLWDRLFRTFRVAANPRELKFGLNDFRLRKDQTLDALLGGPWRRGQRSIDLAASHQTPAILDQAPRSGEPVRLDY